MNIQERQQLPQDEHTTRSIQNNDQKRRPHRNHETKKKTVIEHRTINHDVQYYCKADALLSPVGKSVSDAKLTLPDNTHNTHSRNPTNICVHTGRLSKTGTILLSQAGYGTPLLEATRRTDRK
jgi:hypothetical protein